MKIIIKPEVMYRLLAYAAITRDEYSGFGFVEREGENIVIYDFVLLDVGDFVYTEIEPARVLPLLQRPDRKKMKAWVHRHPMGTGVPGPENWSDRDEMTIQREPLGATPEAVNWSVSVVLTPGGFVGRIDNYVKGITQHLEVEPNTKNLVEEVRELASQGPFVSSTAKRSRKSRGSSNSERSSQFPAQESRRIKATGRSRKSKKTSITNATTEMTTSEFMTLYGNYAGSTIQLQAPLPRSAKTTDWTGATNETDTTENNTNNPSGEGAIK